MNRLTVLFIAMAVLTMTMGCKSDCEKAMENSAKLRGEEMEEKQAAKGLKQCEEAQDDGKRAHCMAEATTKDALKNCIN